ncbi:MAG: hypothetical protein N2167_00240 [Flavobacteriales bacterium]|nr:hypothetical protein [Flavobacteriales bacterium]
MAQKRSGKQERVTVKDVPDEYKHGKKNIKPHQRKKMQTKDFINRRKTYRDKMTKREKRQIDKIIGIDRKAERKKHRKELKEKREFARAERKLRRKHLALQTPEVRKRMKKNLKKTQKEFIALQQKQWENPYSKKPKKRKSNLSRPRIKP